MSKEVIEPTVEQEQKEKIRTVSELEELRVSLSEDLEKAMEAGNVNKVRKLKQEIEDTKIELDVARRVEHEQTLDTLRAEVRKQEDELHDAEVTLLEKAKAYQDVLIVKASREEEFGLAGRRRDAAMSILRGNLSSYGSAKFPIPPGLIGEESNQAQARALTEAAREFSYEHGSDLKPYGGMGYQNWTLSEVENLIARLERKEKTE